MPAIQAQGEGYIGIAGVLAFGASFARPSWDISENERNSFPETEAALLSKITAPLKIEAHPRPRRPAPF
jgi:hypothetical protein